MFNQQPRVSAGFSSRRLGFCASLCLSIKLKYIRTYDKKRKEEERKKERKKKKTCKSLARMYIHPVVSVSSGCACISFEQVGWLVGLVSRKFDDFSSLESKG